MWSPKRNSTDIKGDFDLIRRAASWPLSHVFCSCKVKSIFHHDAVHSECRNPTSAWGQDMITTPLSWACRDGCWGGNRGKETVGRSEVLVTTFLVEQAGHRQSSRLCFSNEWFPWMGIKKSTREDNYVDACDAQALPHIHSTELLAQVAESQKWQVNCNSSIPLWIPSGIC